MKLISSWTSCLTEQPTPEGADVEAQYLTCKHEPSSCVPFRQGKPAITRVCSNTPWQGPPLICCTAPRQNAVALISCGRTEETACSSQQSKYNSEKKRKGTWFERLQQGNVISPPQRQADGGASLRHHRWNAEFYSWLPSAALRSKQGGTELHMLEGKEKGRFLAKVTTRQSLKEFGNTNYVYRRAYRTWLWHVHPSGRISVLCSLFIHSFSCCICVSRFLQNKSISL